VTDDPKGYLSPSIATLEIRVIPPVSHENPRHEPLVLIVSTNEDGARTIRIPWKAWLEIERTVGRAGRDQSFGALTMNFQGERP
jgi:hypothetical protein